ncbi:MAG: sulfite exporter TauE/SafE family protein [Sulfurovum sp.]|nr:sulfite exporter TauE/SafE family protein [Sulfurovum sp.]
MESISLFSLFLIGLTSGATACMFSCMPFLAPLLMTHSTNLKQATQVVLPFSLGRIFSYTMIAMAASLSSLLAKNILEDNTLFQVLLGTVTMLMGIFLLVRTLSKRPAGCHTSRCYPQNIKGALGIFGIGALVSLNPCAPIVTLIALSANTTVWTSAASYGLSFGLGAVLVPFLFYTLIAGTIVQGLIEQFRKYIKYIEIFAASLLILVGIMVFAGKIAL